jgi:transposase InsO family protein
VTLIDEAVVSGARRFMACAELGLSVRTVQRWQHHPEDGRPLAVRPAPANKLTTEEQIAVLSVVNQPEFASVPPHQIVPRLADTGVYLASESTFYRYLKADGQRHRRGRVKAPSSRTATTHEATAPNQLWCWDITWLPAEIRGRFYYWYMMKDVFSRKIVASCVHECESAELAAELLTKGSLREGLAGRPLVLHSDNGSAMKGSTMLACMQNLGVLPSYSRPRVSNDNAHAETLFRTAKYSALWPERSFSGVDAARQWVQRFVSWYNLEHRHSGLQYVTPDQRHRGEAAALLEKRKALYAAAKEKHPERWSGDARGWHLENRVWLNPERDVLAPSEKSAA